MNSEAMASACTNPVVTITIAAMMTAAEPMRSPRTSRYAPRTLMLRFCARPSSHIDTAFATRPTMATTSIRPPCTSASAGVSSRCTASNATHRLSTMSTMPFTSAPRTSAR